MSSMLFNNSSSGRSDYVYTAVEHSCSSTGEYFSSRLLLAAGPMYIYCCCTQERTKAFHGFSLFQRIYISARVYVVLVVHPVRWHDIALSTLAYTAILALVVSLCRSLQPQSFARTLGVLDVDVQKEHTHTHTGCAECRRVCLI